MEEKELLKLGSQALRKAAMNEEAKEFLLENKTLFYTFKKAADRYIGGETLEETIPKVKNFNQKNIKCSIEFMGENTHTEEEAKQATQEFIKVSEEIGNNSLNSTISLDLSHIGLVISRELCIKCLTQICNASLKNNIEVIISAEATDKTDLVLKIYKELSPQFLNLSITLQVYLHRSSDDLNELLKYPGRIRLVKGAFETEDGIALMRGDELDDRYLEFLERILKKNHKCSIATHDKKIQDAAKKAIEKISSNTDIYEFESLYGIQNENLFKIHEDGYPTKVYFVYGKEWYLYVCNRIAEYPLNIFKALNDIVS